MRNCSTQTEQLFTGLTRNFIEFSQNELDTAKSDIQHMLSDVREEASGIIQLLKCGNRRFLVWCGRTMLLLALTIAACCGTMVWMSDRQLSRLEEQKSAVLQELKKAGKDKEILQNWIENISNSLVGMKIGEQGNRHFLFLLKGRTLKRLEILSDGTERWGVENRRK